MNPKLSRRCPTCKAERGQSCFTHGGKSYESNGQGFTHQSRNKKEVAKWKQIHCSYCGADAGSPCMTSSDEPLNGGATAHRARLIAALKPKVIHV